MQATAAPCLQSPSRTRPVNRATLSSARPVLTAVTTIPAPVQCFDADSSRLLHVHTSPISSQIRRLNLEFLPSTSGATVLIAASDPATDAAARLSSKHLALKRGAITAAHRGAFPCGTGVGTSLFHTRPPSQSWRSLRLLSEWMSSSASTMMQPLTSHGHSPITKSKSSLAATKVD
jgi:hypothetical protein